MIPTRAERSRAAERLSHSHNFCSAFGFLTVANIKVEVVFGMSPLRRSPSQCLQDPELPQSRALEPGGWFWSIVLNADPTFRLHMKTMKLYWYRAHSWEHWGRGGDAVHIPTQLTFNWVCWNREPIRKNVTFRKLWNGWIATVLTSSKVLSKSNLFIIWKLPVLMVVWGSGNWNINSILIVIWLLF